MTRSTKKRARAINNKAQTDAQVLLYKKVQAAKKIIDGLEKTTKIYIKAVDNMNVEFKCLQFQLIEQDLESIIRHIEDLNANGPREPHNEVSLADSEEPLEAEQVEPESVDSEEVETLDNVTSIGSREL